MGKVTITPLQEDDPIFKRGPVAFIPASIRETIEARKNASEDETSSPSQKKALNGREGE